MCIINMGTVVRNYQYNFSAYKSMVQESAFVLVVYIKICK